MPTVPRDHDLRASPGDAGPVTEDRPLHKRRLPEPAGVTRETRSDLPPGELPQRLLALELRYSIDLAVRHPFVNRERVRRLLFDNPHGAASRHVAHNLGKRRMNWLRKEGLVMAETNDKLEKAVGGKGIAIKGAVTKTDTEQPRPPTPTRRELENDAIRKRLAGR